MSGVSPVANSERTVAELRSMIYERYGRRATSRRTGRLTHYEAALLISGSAGSMHKALDRVGTSFHIEHLRGRLDLLLADLIEDPDESADDAWACRYGFQSATTAYRAFRNGFGVGTGDVRRVARLADWLVVRTARTTRDREQEARLRIGCLQNWLCNKDLGPRATEAVQRLHAGEAELEGRGPRRRYPPVGKEERRRLEQSVREWAHG